jgi:8-oxo-dGTP pyrophosphatase MutT (NUDIX family)
MGHIEENLIKITSKKPEGYIPRIEIVACYLQREEDYLFLKKSKGRNEEETWGVAGGRVEEGETPFKAVIREVFEETGIKIDPESLSFKNLLYVDNPSFGKYLLHIHSYRCNKEEKVLLSDEHTEYKWLPLENAKKLTLLSGGLQSMSYFEKSLVQEK